MTFSIIIINYKTKELTRDCIKSIFLSCKNINDYEVIVVDNNSSDGSVNYLKQKFVNKIKLIENKKNFGFSKANNIGAREAKGDYLFFLNSDTILTEDVLSDFKNFINQKENLGIIAPKLITVEAKEQLRAYGQFPNLFTTIFNKLKAEKNSQSKVVSVDWVSGAAFIIKKDIFKKVKGFDESFFMYFEDIDLSKRVKDLGFSNIVNKNIVLTHLGGKSINKNKLRKTYYYRSQDYYFKKHFGLLPMLALQLIRFPLRVFNNTLK